jgi:hypothetical protein
MSKYDIGAPVVDNTVIRLLIVLQGGQILHLVHGLMVEISTTRGQVEGGSQIIEVMKIKRSVRNVRIAMGFILRTNATNRIR